MAVRRNQTESHDERMLPAKPLVDEGQRSLLSPEVGEGQAPGTTPPDPTKQPRLVTGKTVMWTIPEFAAKRQVPVEQAMKEVIVLERMGLVAWSGMSSAGEPTFQRSARLKGMSGEN